MAMISPTWSIATPTVEEKNPQPQPGVPKHPGGRAEVSTSSLPSRAMIVRAHNMISAGEAGPNSNMSSPDGR
ncbi:MAG: hypothetical protein ACR2II_07785 [Chthoniobacterales bacterium]